MFGGVIKSCSARLGKISKATTGAWAASAAAPEWMPPPLRPSGSVVEIHVNGWDRAMHWWLRFFALAIELGLGVAIEFGPRNGFRTACAVVFTVVFVGMSWREIAELRKPARLLEFRPASDDFPLRRPELDELRQTDGWYRLPTAPSATASKEFDTRIREGVARRHQLGELS